MAKPQEGITIMAETLETIAARLRLEYPFPQYVDEGGVRREMTLVEYDAWIAQSAANERQAQLAAEAEAARKAALQAQINRLQPILAKLNAVPEQNLTGAETRTVLKDTLLYLLPKMIADFQSQL
jgi:hypothetical protein